MYPAASEFIVSSTAAHQPSQKHRHPRRCLRAQCQSYFQTKPWRTSFRETATLWSRLWTRLRKRLVAAAHHVGGDLSRGPSATGSLRSTPRTTWLSTTPCKHRARTSAPGERGIQWHRALLDVQVKSGGADYTCSGSGRERESPARALQRSRVARLQVRGAALPATRAACATCCRFGRRRRTPARPSATATRWQRQAAAFGGYSRVLQFFGTCTAVRLDYGFPAPGSAHRQRIDSSGKRERLRLPFARHSTDSQTAHAHIRARAQCSRLRSCKIVYSIGGEGYKTRPGCIAFQWAWWYDKESNDGLTHAFLHCAGRPGPGLPAVRRCGRGTQHDVDRRRPSVRAASRVCRPPPPRQHRVPAAAAARQPVLRAALLPPILHCR
ncbi:uncharacterized protein [Dermacentor albipictus]|uniref:uncharacterized protein isoform X2 n=1 Tax=Dermacentor albipictus TaxID=60249 RepID=UPI0031FBA405